MAKGYTLLETVIALGLWLILSAGLFFVWQHSALSATGMMERQSAFENARISMDALKTNFQMSRCIVISDYVMGELALYQRRGRTAYPGWEWHTYGFRLNAEILQIGQPQRSGQQAQWNEFAANIAEIELSYSSARIGIRIVTTCEQTLEGSVCAANKCITIRGVRNANPCPQGRH
ncbi:MAG: hypothetical protein FWF78_08995 [Defluviitaleaceae bacterium]|nr:hypothetical protein [Defluviitaleaceae bacterium]